MKNKTLTDEEKNRRVRRVQVLANIAEAENNGDVQLTHGQLFAKYTRKIDRLSEMVEAQVLNSEVLVSESSLLAVANTLYKAHQQAKTYCRDVAEYQYKTKK